MAFPFGVVFVITGVAVAAFAPPAAVVMFVVVGFSDDDDGCCAAIFGGEELMVDEPPRLFAEIGDNGDFSLTILERKRNTSVYRSFDFGFRFVLPVLSVHTIK